MTLPRVSAELIHNSCIYDGDDRPHATIGYQADLTDESNAWLRLCYQANGEPVDYRVRLVTTTPNYGGHRWWFICPLVRRDGEPPRRVAKLCLPPGETYFGSREGYELTYVSCQESGKYRGVGFYTYRTWAGRLRSLPHPAERAASVSGRDLLPNFPPVIS